MQAGTAFSITFSCIRLIIQGEEIAYLVESRPNFIINGIFTAVLMESATQTRLYEKGLGSFIGRSKATHGHLPYRTAEAKQHAKMEVTTKHMACRLKKNKAIALPTGHYKECFFNQLLHF